jgi:hypothetical protein
MNAGPDIIDFTPQTVGDSLKMLMKIFVINRSLFWEKEHGRYPDLKTKTTWKKKELGDYVAIQTKMNVVTQQLST